MSILLIGDTQIANHKAMGGPVVEGLNRRCREILDGLDSLVRDAVRDHGVDTVIQVGDFFDIAKPSAALYDAVIRLLKRHPVKWHILAGNHDIASYDAPTALAPLGHIENVTVYEKPTLVEIDGKTFMMVPYTGPSCEQAIAAGKAILDEPGRLDGLSDATKESLLYWCVHYGYGLNPHGRPDMFTEGYTPYQGIAQRWFFGHEHGSAAFNYSKGSLYRSLGSFCDFDFGEGSSVPHHAFLLADNNKSRQLDPRGPVFKKMEESLSAQALADRVLAEHDYWHEFNALYIRVNYKLAETAEKLKRAGLVTDYVILPEAVAVSQSNIESAEQQSCWESIAAEFSETDIPEELAEKVYALCDKVINEEKV